MIVPKISWDASFFAAVWGGHTSLYDDFVSHTTKQASVQTSHSALQSFLHSRIYMFVSNLLKTTVLRILHFALFESGEALFLKALLHISKR